MNNIDKKNPFKTPKGYFDSFQARLMDKLVQEEPNVPKNDGFQVPEGYFENLGNDIGQKLKNETKVVQLHPFKKYYIAIASIAAMMLLVLGLNMNTDKNIAFTDLADSDIEAYFDTHELDLSPYEIAEMIPVDELEVSDIIQNQIQENHILEYLNENIDDFEELNMIENE
ncbi:hypothetical protein [Costertonia aggregata]|uniref:Uncharacterized protein n=1 Tax=Costertonia aggregata TaxID=343403 RepID=A0A7H9AKT7_9FLAO|nr:hypothetical protein [Costertonia aggregata]QLG43944.1 hypothetical protein HYG79_00800 [Costertonia aggregata]